MTVPARLTDAMPGAAEGVRGNQPRLVPSALQWRVDVVAIERARILRGWSRRDLAEAAHVDPGTVNDLIRGRRRTTFGCLHEICRALELRLRDVLNFGDDSCRQFEI